MTDMTTEGAAEMPPELTPEVGLCLVLGAVIAGLQVQWSTTTHTPRIHNMIFGAAADTYGKLLEHPRRPRGWMNHESAARWLAEEFGVEMPDQLPEL